MKVVFYVAEDRETGKIIDSCFLMSRPTLQSPDSGDWLPDTGSWDLIAERSARETCQSWNYDMIDFDGPFSETLWRMGIRKPKWETTAPPRIAPDKWAQRFKSHEELAAYKAGMRAGRESKSKPSPRNDVGR
jgi:hypothetical protein